MKWERTARPRAREKDLIVEEIGDETLVYDLRDNRVHCLNSICARIWRACDGQNEVRQLIAAAPPALDPPEAREMIGEALRGLARVRLLEEPVVGTGLKNPSRRRFAGTLAKAAAALPIIATVQAPLAKEKLRSCSNDCSGLSDCTPCKKGQGNGPCNKVCCKGECVNTNQAERMGCNC